MGEGQNFEQWNFKMAASHIWKLTKAQILKNQYESQYESS